MTKLTHLILTPEGWKAFKMPEKETVCKKLCLVDCSELCSIEINFKEAIRSAIDNAVKVEDQNWVNHMVFCSLKNGAIIEDMKPYPIPSGYSVEVEEVPCKKGEFKCEDACYGTQSGGCNYPVKTAKLVKIWN